MSKSVTINGKAAMGTGLRSEDAAQDSSDRKDHLKVWREIYQDVRRQWAEAENYKSRKSRS